MTRSAAFALFILAGISTSTFAQEKLPDAPFPAREAAARMAVPDGFKVTLFAGEPDVVQPIAFTFDDRGRLWVVEGMSYPKWNKDIATEKVEGGRVIDKRKGKDRIVILEDTDGDGQHDKRTVFADNLTNLSGIEYGFGGIWLCSIPNLIYIPIKEERSPLAPREDGKPHAEREVYVTKPAGPPEIKLDGWSLQSGHNAFNSLKWGPDGWLYGCNGILATSQVGAPGTPDKDRTPMNCGVWRYHPTKKKFEVFATGTTNPWGLDWDQYGELFITNCVIDHVWHVVQGGHYERMYGQDFNPHLYKLMPSIADHKHWAGGSWTDSRGGKGAHSDAGGGHAHVGCMIYQGDNWPAKYRNTLFTLNLHGNRINNDILERKGSSYVARHGKDFLMANDPWFRGIGIDYGPDGGVYVSDWCDTGECHNYQVAQTATGRIYKVVHGQPKAWQGDLAKLTDRELIDIHGKRNIWFARHARRILQERHATGRLAKDTIEDLRMSFIRVRSLWLYQEEQALRYLWALNGLDGMDNEFFASHVLDDPSQHVRTWGFRFAIENEELTKNKLPNLLRMVHGESSGLARTALYRGLTKLPVAQRFEPASLILGFHDESIDQYAQLLLWYAIEPLAETNFAKTARLVAVVRTPILREFLARRLASIDDTAYARLIDELRADLPTSTYRDILRGLQAGIKGRRSLTAPKSWTQLSDVLLSHPHEEVRQTAVALAVQFNDQYAMTLLQNAVVDQSLSRTNRTNALETLLSVRPSPLAKTLETLIDDAVMRSAAIRGLAAYSLDSTPDALLRRFSKFTPDDKSDAVHTLASRPSYALALLDAVAAKTVARTDLNAFTVRQLLALNDKQVTKRVNEVWGTLRPASQEKAALMAKYKAILSADTMKSANVANGRLLYSKNCAACHKLFGEGGNIGPELTGSQRANLEYVLENMLDPSAVVPREYQVQTVVTNSGRTITGIVKEETERAVTLQTQNELIILPKDEIDSRRGLNVSMMPEGMLDRMTPDEVRDLVAYLASK